MEEKIIKKSEKLINKAEKQLEKGNIEKAVQYFTEAKELYPTPKNIDKLIQSHQQLESNWTEEDFINHLGWTMEKQELLDPHMKRVHARFEPSWKEVQDLISRLFQSPNEQIEKSIIEQIIAHETDALYPLIDTLLQLRDKLTSLSEFDVNDLNPEINIAEAEEIEDINFEDNKN